MYQYHQERNKLFTESGAEVLLKIRDKTKELLKEAGAFRADKVMSAASGDTFTMLAAIDYLVEKEEIVELPRDCWGQFKVYSTPQVHNR